jgi:hypothetical protein
MSTVLFPYHNNNVNTCGNLYVASMLATVFPNYVCCTCHTQILLKNICPAIFFIIFYNKKWSAVKISMSSAVIISTRYFKDKKMKIIKWSGQVQDRLKWKGIVEKPRLYHSCRAIEKEDFKHKRSTTDYNSFKQINELYTIALCPLT